MYIIYIYIYILVSTHVKHDAYVATKRSPCSEQRLKPYRVSLSLHDSPNACAPKIIAMRLM